MDQNSEILGYMQSEVESFKELLSALSGKPIDMINIAEELEFLNAPCIKSSSSFIPKNKEDSKRYNADTNTYNVKPLDPEYTKKYYAKNCYLVQCDLRGAETKKLTLWRHKKTNKCKKLAESNQNSQ